MEGRENRSEAENAAPFKLQPEPFQMDLRLEEVPRLDPEPEQLQLPIPQTQSSVKFPELSSEEAAEDARRFLSRLAQSRMLWRARKRQAESQRKEHADQQSSPPERTKPKRATDSEIRAAKCKLDELQRALDELRRAFGFLGLRLNFGSVEERITRSAGC